MSLVVIEESSTETSCTIKYRLEYTWPINDFAATHLMKSSGKDSYPTIFSTPFGSPQDKKTRFMMKVKPNGVSSAKPNYLGLYLSFHVNDHSSLNPTHVRCKLSLLNDRNEKCHTREFRTERMFLLEFPCFLSHTHLLDPANGLLPGDQLTILAEVDVYEQPVGQFENSLLLAQCTAEAKENVAVSLETLLKSREHADVILVLDDGTELAAHKNLLSLHSPVFNAMFKSDLVEQEVNGRIRIRDMKFEAARSMLYFIYTGNLIELDSFSGDLYEAADKYGITRMKQLSCQYLCDKVSQKNAASILAFADRHSVDQLKKACTNCIRSHLEEVVLCKNWSLIDKLFIEELRLLKLKEKKQEKMEETPEEPQVNNQPALPKYRLLHKWVIKDFAATYLAEIPHKDNYQKIYSAFFSSSLDCSVDFRLRLEPRGDGSEANRSAFSLFIEVVHLNQFGVKSTEINCQFSLLNVRNEKYNTQEFRSKVARYDGYDSFLSHAHLRKPAKGLLPDDQLTILAEIDVFPELPGSELRLEQIKWAARENVASSLGTLLDSGDYSDVILVVKGQDLAAHKNILSAHSSVFNELLKSEIVEGEEGRVVIQDLEVDVAKVMLRFIYTGEAEDLEKYAQELLIAADKYDITKLKSQCCQYLCGSLDTDNVAAMLTFAHRHFVDQLKKACVKYISDHWQEVVVHKDWPLIDKLFIEELRLLKQKEKKEIEEEIM